jgi:hypothetical protein
LILTFCCVGAACAPAPTESQSMNQHTIAPGEWKKTTRSPCSAQYPDVLVLHENGIYHGGTEPPGNFTYWDAGSYRVVAPGKVEISTANDAVIAYAYSVEKGVLKFHDAAGCQFEYQLSQ